MDGGFEDIVKRWLEGANESVSKKLWGETGTPASQPGGMQWPDAPVFQEEDKSVRSFLSGGNQEFFQVMGSLAKATGYGLKDVVTELFGGKAPPVTREPKAPTPTATPTAKERSIARYQSQRGRGFNRNASQGTTRTQRNTNPELRFHQNRSTSPSVQLRRQLFGGRGGNTRGGARGGRY